MTISQAGIDLIKKHEKCRLVWYLPTQKDKPTVGWGHMDPVGVIGTTITQTQADEFLEHDLDHFDECVADTCPGASQLQHDAMCCLAYNIGCGAFRKSSVARLHNAGRYSEAAQAFGLFNEQKGNVLIELVHRRAEEAALYASGTTVAPGVAVPVAPIAEGPKPILANRTIIGTASATVGTVTSVASQIHDQTSAVRQATDGIHDAVSDGFHVWQMVGHHLGIAALILVVFGLAWICYSWWQDHNSGRH